MVEKVESLRDFDDSGSDPTQVRWKAELKIARDYYKDYYEKCQKIIRSYRDERDKRTSDVITDQRRINLLWSNTQTLKPAVLAKKPKPAVTRRNNDSDPVSSIAAQTLERCIEYVTDDDEFDYALFAARDDYLLLSRGVVWPVFTADVNPQGVSGENILCDYVLYSDFLQSPARNETEVRWKARRAYMNRDQLTERFGEEKGKAIPLTYTDEATKKSMRDDEEQGIFKQAEIWEIWCLTDKKIYWICENYDEVCDEKDDFLGLTKFFPCPRPAYGVMTNNTLVPVPEYDLYRDQARAIDEYETRIQALRNAMRVRGFYNAEIEELQRLYQEAGENDLIPVEDWALLAQGGIEGNVLFAPLKEIIAAVIELSNAIEQEKQRIYEITGISDIVRGASDPSETATAQRLKGQFGNLRLEDKRREINRFAKGILETVGEIISEHYSPEMITQMAGVQVIPPPQPQLDPQNGQPMPAQKEKLVYPKVYADEYQQALELLRNDLLRKFRIEIETDSTIVADEQAEKEAATEMVTALGGFLTQAVEIGKAAPPMIPVIGETLLFMMRKFRAGRALEGVIEQAVEQMEAIAANPQPQPDPEMLKVQASKEKDQAELQLKTQETQATLQLKQQELQANMQMKQQELESTMQMKQEEMHGNMQLEKYKADLNAQNAVEVEKQKGKTQLASARMVQMDPKNLEHQTINEEGEEGPSPLMQQMTQIEASNNEKLDQIAQMQAQQTQVLMQMLMQLSLPKRVIRDQTGVIVGVESVQEKPPTMQ